MTIVKLIRFSVMKNNSIESTKLPNILIKRLDNFFKNQNEEIKLDIFSEKRNQFFKLKNIDSSTDNLVLELKSFYSAIDYFYNLHENANSKNKSMLTKDLKKYNEFTIKSSKKQNRSALKEEFLVDKSSIVNDLLLSRRSYREISYFFSKYHNKSISHTYIRRVITKYPEIFDLKEAMNNAIN